MKVKVRGYEGFLVSMALAPKRYENILVSYDVNIVRIDGAIISQRNVEGADIHFSENSLLSKDERDCLEQFARDYNGGSEAQNDGQT